MTIEEGIEALENMIYFGVKLDKKLLFNKLDLIVGDHNIDFIVKAKIIIDKAVAGRKIAKFIIDQMNDEFELKPLRRKIELRRFEDLIASENNYYF